MKKILLGITVGLLYSSNLFAYSENINTKEYDKKLVEFFEAYEKEKNICFGFFHFHYYIKCKKAKIETLKKDIELLELSKERKNVMFKEKHLEYLENKKTKFENEIEILENEIEIFKLETKE